jgi:hypothetical protein
MASPDGDDRAVRTAGLVLALTFGVLGFVIAFGVWSVGYCGSLTPDSGEPGTLRHDLCHGTSGNLMSGLVFLSWIVAAVAPLVGMRWALQRGERWPLVVTSAVGAVPILTIMILAKALPQG